MWKTIPRLTSLWLALIIALIGVAILPPAAIVPVPGIPVTIAKASTVTVGSGATDRASYGSSQNATWVDKSTPLSVNGTITSVSVYAVSGYTLNNVQFGLFYVVSGNNLTARATTANLGSVVGGSKVDFSVSLAGEVGDYLGIYYDYPGNQRIEADTTANQTWYKGQNQMTATNVAFLLTIGPVSIEGNGFASSGTLTEISQLYYDATQDDGDTKLSQAATDLKTYWDQMSGASLNITTVYPAIPAIYFSVNATMLSAYGDEGYRLQRNASGITITGKTALAVRNGTYDLLDRLGVRFFMKDSAWTVVPASLPSLDALDVYVEPDFDIRGLFPNGYAVDNITDQYSWNHRNRIPGNKITSANHTYNTIAPIATYNATHPKWYTNNGDTGWQLDPTAQGDGTEADALTAQIVGLANTSAATTNTTVYGVDDSLLNAVFSVTPKDGGTWAPVYDNTDTENITDAVFTLASNVASSNFSTLYPNNYISTLNYNIHANVPSIALPANLLAWITNGQNYTKTPGETTSARATGLKAKGIKVGLYEYWDWELADSAVNNLDWDAINNYAWWYNSGNATAYISTYHNGWGGRGIQWYVMSKVLWDTSTSVNTTLDDFYSKAFGAASGNMTNFFETMYNIGGTDNASLQAMFNDLYFAETAANGDAAILARIRYMEYYARFLWKYYNLGYASLSNADATAFYTFVTKVRYLSVLDYADVESVLNADLVSRGYSAGQITALQDYTVPTADNATTWLTEGVTAFNALAGSQRVAYQNPRYSSTLAALGSAVSANVPMEVRDSQYLVYSSGSENVSIQIKGVGTIEWYSPSAIWLQSVDVNSAGDYTTVNFTATDAGYYLLQTGYSRWDSFTGYIQISNRNAAMFASDVLMWTGAESTAYYSAATHEANDTATTYFYVPKGTANFIFGVKTFGGFTATGNLTSPNNVITSLSTTTSANTTISSPIPGLWTLTIQHGAREGNFWFTGIPPLVWYDPEYLLYEEGVAGSKGLFFAGD